MEIRHNGRPVILTRKGFKTLAYPIYTHTSAEAERGAAIALERATYGDLFPVVLNIEQEQLCSVKLGEGIFTTQEERLEDSPRKRPWLRGPATYSKFHQFRSVWR